MSGQAEHPIRFWRRVIYGFAVLMLLATAGFLYLQSDSFAGLVRRRLVTVLETATGGRVELGGFAWHPLRLEAEVTGLTIHGLEGPGEVPYAHVERLAVQLKIISLLRARIGLSRLEVDHPVIHLIVYPNGSTNQPEPRRKTASDTPVMNTIFDLEADRVSLARGIFLLNQRALPFNLAAKNVSALVTYRPRPEAYLASLRVEDLTAQRGRAPAVRSRLDLSAELMRNALLLDGLHFTSGGSTLAASGMLHDLSRPRWKLGARGAIDLREVAALAAVDGLGPGELGLDLSGEGSTPAGSALPVFALQGNIRLKDATYHANGVLLRRINATGALAATGEQVELTNVKIRLPEGGVDASAKLVHYLDAPAPTGGPSSHVAPGSQPQQGLIRARLYGIRPETVFEIIELSRYENLGFDTEAEGSAELSWRGSLDDMVISARLALAPPVPPTPREVPVNGTVDATYAVRGGVLDARRLELHTPASSLTASGRASFVPPSGATALAVDFSTRNLNEFDRALIAFGVKANGRKGVAAIPVALHGSAQFHGAVRGSLDAPDAAGHLSVRDFATVIDTAAPTRPPPQPATPVSQEPPHPPPPSAGTRQTVQWDDLEADARYTPSLISVKNLLLTRSATGSPGRTVIRGGAELHAARGRHRQPVFNQHATLAAEAHVSDASLTDLLSIAGEDLPVTGTLNLNAHASGPLDALDGGGHLAVTGGSVYGEPYQSLTTDLVFVGQSVKASGLVFAMDGGRITGDGGYDLGAERFTANLDGAGFSLAKIHTLQSAKYQAGGSLNFSLHASGKVEEPAGQARVALRGLTLNGQPAGDLQAEAHTSGRLLLVNATSTLAQAQLRLAGQMGLTGQYPVEARLNFDRLDFAPLLKLLDVQGVRGSSELGGVVNVSGPARTPRLLAGTATIEQFHVTLEGMPLTSRAPIRASLARGVVTLEPLEIDAEDTSLAASGTADLLGAGGLNLRARGGVNARLAQSFNPEISSSGHVTFHVTATGALKHPDLEGQFDFSDVSLAYQEVPNGISHLNGSMVFNQDRLELRNLAGTTGGGTVALGGFLVYQHGIYGDVTATLSNTRFRYAGLSTTADAKLRMQGNGDSLLVSGRVTITRFLVGPNVDLAALAGSNAVAPPPDPNAFGNRVRMDVRITSSPQMDFQNSFAQIAGSVDLRIRGTLEQPAVLGRINITDGRATYNGTTYQLQHGDIYFTNPVKIEPTIDLDASTRIEEYDVTIGLHGTADRLQPTFRSEPPLPEADVISLLAQGRTQEEQSIYNTQQQQAGVNGTANAVLSGALNATVSNRIQKLFGVGSVKIDPTYTGSLGQSSARITVTQNIGQQVLLTYATSVNAETQQLIQAQVNLTPTFSVTARRDEADVFSLIFKIHRRYR